MDLDTGDLILFDYMGTGLMGLFTSMIKYFTKSDYSHIAMVLKNPTFLNEKLEGLYIWESGWEGTRDPQDNKIKLGVQITPLNEILNKYEGKIYVRKLLNGKDKITNDKLRKIHNIVYEKPYDIMASDWVEALFRKDKQPQKTNRFWCSAFVGYIYTKCELISSDTDWSILRPCDFSSKSQHIKLQNNVKLDINDIEIK